MHKSTRYTTEFIVGWYFIHIWKQAHDGGLFPWLSNEQELGFFAIDSQAVEMGDDRALFKTLITLAMFQRLRDTFVVKILRSLSREDVAELTDPERLFFLARTGGCSHSATQESLQKVCNLAKDPQTGVGICAANPDCVCYLKRHTILLRRYGHFGKIPTSAALALQDSWGGSLSALRSRVFMDHLDPLVRSQALEAELNRVWRINKKVASMFLSAISAPDLGLETPPWRKGLDWTWFLPIDVNIDKFLVSVGWGGPWTYAARRQAILDLSKEVSLASFQPGLQDYNPRLVLQAINRFMSKPNRRAISTDCSFQAPHSCANCPTDLKAVCPFGSNNLAAPVPTNR